MYRLFAVKQRGDKLPLENLVKRLVDLIEGTELLYGRKEMGCTISQ